MLNFPLYPNPYQQPYQQTQQVPQNNGQIQNGGFVGASTIEEARNYPVAPGHAVTFKIYNQQIVCEKIQGFSQFEAPQFKVYKLVEEDYNAPTIENTSCITKDEYAALCERIEALEKSLNQEESEDE